MEQVKTRSKLDEYFSKTYKVIFHNDNKTTFEFVTFCLVNIFLKSVQDAIQLTINVDQNGSCVAGNGYARDIAEIKKNQVLELAKQNEYPFQVTVEEE